MPTILPVGPHLFRGLTVADRDAARARLRREAERALTQGPFSVTTDSRLPPSGDPHDYRSWGSYWWPDPSKPGGLPWIRRDGVLNEAAHAGNRRDLERMTAAVGTLALAFAVMRDGRYAAQAGRLLRVWFLDAATRMNPHLRYAQAIPGVCEGRGIGLIDTQTLVTIPDAASGLVGSAGWTEREHAELRAWFDRYREWFLRSELGREECRQRNNHGTYYDLQLAVYALFTGHAAQAREAIQRMMSARVALVEADGSMPAELRRTRSYDYTLLNLRGLLLGAAVARHLDLDVVGAATSSGQRLRAAVNWLEPYVASSDRWPARQITPFRPWTMGQALALAALVLDEPQYAEWLNRLPAPVGGKPAAWYLMFSGPDETD